MPRPKATIWFAHGAGAGPESDFMTGVSEALAGYGWPVHCVTFPFWQQVRKTGQKRPPDRPQVLDQHLLESARQTDGPIVVMGKSMGARVAFRVADQVPALAAIGLGFPFHPPGRPGQHRLTELPNHRRRNLILHGTRDPFGKPDWLQAQSLPENLELRWFAGGDHDLKRTRKMQPDPTERFAEIAEFITCWLQEHYFDAT